MEKVEIKGFPGVGVENSALGFFVLCQNQTYPRSIGRRGELTGLKGGMLWR